VLKKLDPDHIYVEMNFPPHKSTHKRLDIEWPLKGAYRIQAGTSDRDSSLHHQYGQAGQDLSDA